MNYLPKTVVLAASESFESASLFASKMRWNCRLIDVKYFENGELNIILPKIEGNYNKILIFTRNNRDANSALMQTYFIASRFLQLHPNVQVEVIFTYFPYSRHDNIIEDEKFSTFHYVLKLLKVCGVQKVYTIDLHSNVKNSLMCENKEFVENIPITGLLNNIISSNNISTVIFPDYGSKNRLHGKITNVISTITCKKVRGAEGEVFAEASLDNIRCNKKSCIIVDDVVHSCNTLLNVVRNVLSQAEFPLFCFVTHLDITRQGLRLLNSLQVEKLYTTNSVIANFGALSVPNEVLLVEDILEEYFLKKLML